MRVFFRSPEWYGTLIKRTLREPQSLNQLAEGAEVSGTSLPPVGSPTLCWDGKRPLTKTPNYPFSTTYKLPAQPSQDLAKRFMKAWFETAKELKARRRADSSPTRLATDIIAKLHSTYYDILLDTVVYVIILYYAFYIIKHYICYIRDLFGTWP